MHYQAIGGFEGVIVGKARWARHGGGVCSEASGTFGPRHLGWFQCSLSKWGFLNGIFHPCALWVRGLNRLESCRQTAVGVTWKFRLSFWPGNYIWSFQIGTWLIWELSEFWYRGSTQNFDPDWSSIVIWPGEPFWKHVYLVCISKNTMFMFGEH